MAKTKLTTETEEEAQALANSANGLTSGTVHLAVEENGTSDPIVKTGGTTDSTDNGTATDSSSTATESSSSTTVTHNYYDPSSDAAYQSALAALQDVNGQRPSYTSSYSDQLNDLYQQIVNRDKFSYDLNADALYKQYAQQYMQNGQLAMMDSIGQAAAANGGYGSSYGQQVGQQTYNSYLQGLNDVIPELYDRAYQQYSDEGDAMLTQYSLLGDLADDEYDKYLDTYNQWLTDRSYQQGLADDAYTRGLNQWTTEYENEQTRLATRAESLAAIGDYSGYVEMGLMTEEEAAQQQKAWIAQNAALAKKLGYVTTKKSSSYTNTTTQPTVITEKEYVDLMSDPEFRADAKKKFASGEYVIAPRTEVR